jgi:hypothetical protein
MHVGEGEQGTKARKSKEHRIFSARQQVITVQVIYATQCKAPRQDSARNLCKAVYGT